MTEPRRHRRPTFQAHAPTISADRFVHVSVLDEEAGFPALIEARVPGSSAAEWARSNRAHVDKLLDTHGAVLFRQFEARDVDAFEQFIGAASTKTMDYIENTSPREIVRGLIRTSTEYPPEHRIVLHNEHSYSAVCPGRLAFFCMRPPDEGGRTPLADCRRVLQNIDPSIRARFEQRRWRYVRNFGDGLGPSWQAVFMTDDPEAVERHCRSADIDWEWLGGGRLRTRQVRTPTVLHPRTHQESWFNHIAFWHVTSLEPAVRDALLASYPDEDLPNQTYYGDGEPIEGDVIEALREAYDRAAVYFTWRHGDILLVDNFLVAHGREPYTGPRRILFTMLDPTRRRDVEPQRSRGEIA